MVRQAKVIAGVMNWGAWGKKLDKVQMTALLHALTAVGVYRYDHADIYGGYTTEMQWGSAYKATGIPREEIEIISKCGIMMPAKARPHIIHKHYNHSYQHIITSVDRSIDNLQCGYLDLLLIHRPGPLMQYEEIARAAHDLISSGRIRGLGVSNFSAPQIDGLSNLIPISAHQIELSIEHHQPMTDGQLDYLQRKGIPIMAWSPLAGGRLFDPSLPIHHRLRSLADSTGMSIDALAYSFLTRHPAGIDLVVGTTDIRRIETALLASLSGITTELWHQIYTAALGHPVA